MTGIILMLGVIAGLVVFGFFRVIDENCKRLDKIGTLLVAIALKNGITFEEIGYDPEELGVEDDDDA